MLRQCLKRGQCLQKPLLVKAALNKSASRLDLSVFEYAEGGTNNFPLFWHGENNCDEAFWVCSSLEEWVEAVCLALEDTAARKGLVKAALTFARERFSPERAYAEFDTLLASFVG